MQDNGNNRLWWILIGALVIACLCLSVLACLVAGGLIFGVPIFREVVVATPPALPR
jgi:hypothetical protein